VVVYGNPTNLTAEPTRQPDGDRDSEWRVAVDTTITVSFVVVPEERPRRRDSDADVADVRYQTARS